MCQISKYVSMYDISYVYGKFTYVTLQQYDIGLVVRAPLLLLKVIATTSVFLTVMITVNMVPIYFRFCRHP